MRPDKHKLIIGAAVSPNPCQADNNLAYYRTSVNSAPGISAVTTGTPYTTGCSYTASSLMSSR